MLASLALLVPIAIGSASAAQDDEIGPFRTLAFEAALEAAKKESKIVMVDFFTTWCGPCKELDRTTWKDETVVRWLADKTVALKIDAEEQVDLARKYRVQAYPSIVFIKPDGTEIGRIVGYRPPDEFVDDAEITLSGKSRADALKEKLAGSESDPLARMKHADALLEEERYEEALAEYLWCWDHGLEAGPSYSGVRSSFLLMYFNRLERVHPPTRAALVERRDALQARLVPGSDWRSALDDFLTLDEHLKESKAIAHFDALLANAEAAEIRRALVEAVAPELVEQRRYADVVSHVPKLDTWIAEQAQKLNLAESQPEGQEAQVVAYLKRSILGPALTYYEALAGTPEAPGSPGSSAAAGQPSLSEFERAILRIDDSSRTWADLIEAAVRAEAFDRGRALRDEALGHFTERSDVRRIERAAKKLPEPAAAPETPTRD